MNSRFPILFDGAMGSYYESLYPDSGPAELSLIQNPERIYQIHKDYILAGAGAIKTCSFQLPQMALEGRSDTVELMEKAVRTARMAADANTLVFADLGPVSPPELRAEIWKKLAKPALEQGIRYFLLETLDSLEGVEEFSSWLKAQEPEAFVLASFACGSDSYTISGCNASSLIQQADAIDSLDAAGLNCMSGPAHMLSILKSLPQTNKPLSFMPNAGYPTITRAHAGYDAQPDYFASIVVQAAQAGAQILGGCCGTVPEHVSMVREYLADLNLSVFSRTEEKEVPVPKPAGTHWHTLAKNRKIIAVEMDPPKTDQIAPFMAAASRLHKAGADLITLADCPIGRPRADSSLLACKIKRELGVEVLPHMTCRDRNLNAARALLLGLSMENVHDILLVTGDPVPKADRQEVKSVFSYHSRGLARYVSSLYPQSISEPFNIFGALDLNAPHFDVQLAIAKEKEEAGMIGFLTQPVLSKTALENLKKAREQLSGLIFGGILPVVSYKNAVFLHNEISGMRIDEEIIEAYKDKDRAQSEEIALALSLQTAEKMADYVDGFYCMTPFFRIDLMCSLLEGIKAKGLA